MLIQSIKKYINGLLNCCIIPKCLLKITILKKRFTNQPINLIIGSGNIYFPDWLSTDKSVLDITNSDEWAFYFKKDSIDKILAEHVFEHLSEVDRTNALKNIFIFLKPAGFLRIAVPDGYFPDQDYINQVKPGGYGSGADYHKFLYTCDVLGRIVADFGFKVSFLEYFDVEGKFHYKEWDQKQGMIIRSVRFDERNQSGEIRYTSLILDAYKRVNITSLGKKINIIQD